MKIQPGLIPGILLACLLTSCQTQTQLQPPPQIPQAAAISPPSVDSEAVPPVTAPPESFFMHLREGDRDAARKFYKKYIDVKGLAVVASDVVADAALQRDYYIVTHMLAGRPDILKAMADAGTHLIIIGKDQLYTDMPEYRNTQNAAYMNERVRGTGGIPVSSFGEENLLCLPTDRYDTESIAVHEFCHTIDSALGRIDPTWRRRLQKTFHDALDKGLWKNTYAGSNAAEFWAETCQMYFDCNRANNWNHGPIARREQLAVYDPETYELIKTTFNLSPAQDWRYQWLQKLPNVAAPPASFRIDPYYTKFTWASEFPIIGRGASDEALLKANDTLVKMFSYRHDILKAMINDGVKMVVLGRNEKLIDLPELKNTTDTNVDFGLRFLDYSPATKLLVVPEENVSADPNQPCVGPSLEIHELAKAIYDVCGTRPVDPTWDSRRDVQQYEMRVKRLDIQFDESLGKLYDAAMTKKMWKDTPATEGRVAYWTEGVLAYFDAAGQTGTPFVQSSDTTVDFSGSPHPINTREALKAYDPDLFSLVNETMSYDGHPDWRFSP